MTSRDLAAAGRLAHLSPNQNASHFISVFLSRVFVFVFVFIFVLAFGSRQTCAHMSPSPDASHLMSGISPLYLYSFLYFHLYFHLYSAAGGRVHTCHQTSMPKISCPTLYSYLLSITLCLYLNLSVIVFCLPVFVFCPSVFAAAPLQFLCGSSNKGRPAARLCQRPKTTNTVVASSSILTLRCRDSTVVVWNLPIKAGFGWR